ncbi:small nucleolar ribonucleoprotein complex subunit [Microthyrium microscopicum]|uniref:U three protein 7 n=1 Tax=Microthyrium microscopicum TaxID=703497 RepID=A0A6A6U5P3_9PEZI|nr:small nucleolar ribonucleoprotein complex subunit [Microthyrium microscopicum]
MAPTSKQQQLVDADTVKLKAHEQAATTEYGRGDKIRTKSIKDKKLRGNLKALEEKFKDAAIRAKDAEILLEHNEGLLEPDGPLERTYKVKQEDILAEVSTETAKKGFELKLEELGPYKTSYTRNGRQLLLAGRKGHIATMDWRDGALGCEIQLQETVRDATWLHNSLTFAVAQKKYVYIYDQSGVEIHRLDKHIEVQFMEFLPFHFLLSTIGNAGYLKYTDTSTGQLVTELPTKLGTPTSLTQNPHNAIMHVGHQNGTVTLWSPNSSTPLVKMLAHRGPVRSMGIDRDGRYMVSTGSDSKMAVWDIRMFKPVNTYFLRTPGTSLDISDRNMTAVSWGTQVTVWKGLFDKNKADQEKVQSPYMAWGGEGQRVENVQWCPFEDILGVSHDKGFTSVLVPGAGEPNFDALEVNPYETKKQRQESEVRGLMNKLQPGMISLNPEFVGTIDLATHITKQREKDLDRKPEDKIEQLKNRGRGRNSALRRLQRKRGMKNVIDERKVRIEEMRKKQTTREQDRLAKQQEQFGPALSRFAQKGG